MATTPSTPSGAAPKASFSQRVRSLGKGLKDKVAGMVPSRKTAGTPELSLEEKLRQDFTGFLARGVEVYGTEITFPNKAATLDSYFTAVIPYHAKPEAAVAQYKWYGSEFHAEAWIDQSHSFDSEGLAVAQLFMEHFPVAQSHLPLRYSKRWAEDRLGDLRVYLHNKRAAPKDWDQAKAHDELVNGFTDDKNIKRYHKQHRGRQKLWRGIGITAASAALLSMGLYFHNREGKVNELEGKVDELDKSVLRLTTANAELDAKNKQWYGDRLKAESERDALKGTVNALNTHYDALNVSDVTAVRRAVCDYLKTVNGEIVFRYGSAPHNSALSQLFAAMVGSSSGRDPKEYDVRRAHFVAQMKPVFPSQDPSGSYYQFFVNDTCPK